MRHYKSFMLAIFPVVLACVTSLVAYADEITATPGTYELIEQASMDFDARKRNDSALVEQYTWEIVHGTGARLVNANKARVTFVAPAINEETRLFTLQLTLRYRSGEPSKAQINIRVHKKTKEVVVRRRSPWLAGAVGFGFGYLWGGWWPHPPIIVIPIPPPDTIWPPEEVPPVALPLPEDPSFEEWAASHPELVNDYIDDGSLEESLQLEPAPDIEADSEPGIEADTTPMIEPVHEPEPMPAPEAIPEPMPEPMMEPMDVPMDIFID